MRIGREKTRDAGGIGEEIASEYAYGSLQARTLTGHKERERESERR